MAKKIQGSIPRAKADKTNEITVTDSRTGKVKASIFTKDTQFGTPTQSAVTNPKVKTYGDVKAYAGVSGSLTRLVTGESYMVAGSGITITSGSNGQVTITAGSISPASSLTMGNGFDPYNTTYNGTSPTSVAILAETNKGIGVSSSGLKLNPGNLNSTTSATTSWEVIVADGSDPYRTTINNLLNLGINSNVTLTNPLTLNSAGGIRDTGGATQYNNTATVDLALKIDPNKGLATTTSGLKIDPSNLSSVTVASGDKVLIGDIDDSDNIRYVTAQSIANLASVGTLPNPLTIGSGLSPNSSTFDGSSPVTVAVAAADSTISSTSSGVSVLKVPNSLTSGNGIDTLDFDGSSPLTVKVKAASSKGLDSQSSGIGLDFSNLTNSSPSAADYVAFRDYDTGAQVRTDFTTIQTNFVQPLVDASRALGTPHTLDQGAGINTFSFNGSVSGVTVSIDQTTVPMLANNNTYTGIATFTNGLSGSLTTLADGTSYIVAGNNIEITSGSNGQITITSTASGGVVSGSISNVTQANPGVVTTVNDHNLNENQGVTITDVLGMTELNGNKYFADVLSPTTFALYSDSLLSTPLDTTAFTAYTSGGKFVGESGSGSPVAFVSGSTTINTVDNVNVTNLGILQDLGSGDIAITGSIGIAEDGSYTDGLFTDFTSQTPIGTAVDRFNEVLKGLAPSAAPQLDDIDCADAGTSANLSFGSSQSINLYTNVQPSTLSPTDNLPDADINSTYSSQTVSNDVRVACFGEGNTINGNLNADVVADSPNYPADALGNGDQGNLYLYVNDNSSPIHSVDLSTFGSGNSLNGDGSGFNLSAITDGSFNDGTPFTTFKHRTGTYVIASGSQQNGWNYARVTHVIGASTSTTNYVEWVVDPNIVSLTDSNSALGSLSMTGTKHLSGVKYNTDGTATYTVDVDNAYRNVYSTSNITFNGTNLGNETQSFPAIDYGAGEDESKQLNLSQLMTINVLSILNGSITTTVTVPHPLKPDLSGAGSQSISGILLYAYSDNATATSENFRGESYRLKSGAYAAQSDVTDSANAWDSTTSLLTVDGLLFYDRKLYRPDFGGVSGDYRNTADGGSITNGPSSNVTYTSITSGTRTFYRKIQNNSGGSKSNFSITINGSGTIVDNTATLDTDKIQVFLKLPTNSSAFSTGWMDLALPFATGQNGDNAGCLDGALDSSLNATNNATFGTQSAENNDWIVLKILADATWTGNISSISISWS